MTRSIVVFALLASASCTSVGEESGPLPAAKQIKSLTIRFEHWQLGEVSFTAMPDDWVAIHKTLLPSRRDENPASWEWLGTAEFVLKDDQPYRVELYQTSRDPGAFAAGKTFKERVYYRGGKSADLQETLLAVFEKAEKKEVDEAHIRNLFRRADKLEIKVAKDAGGYYKTLTLPGVKGNDQIEPLVEHLNFVGNGVPREPGAVSTTVAADITASRRGKTLATVPLRGNEIWFGPDYGFQATLETDDLYRELRKLVGDPLQ